jgi:hypothetical protein
MLDRWGFDLFRLVEQPTAFVIWTIAFGTIVRLICSWLLGFGTGEAYYFSTIRQLALSYYDQPPLFLWLGWLTEYITGSDSAFIIRLPFLLMFAATTWLTYRLGGLLFDQQVGALAALLLNLSPVFGLSVGSWFQPDGPLMLFWLAASVCVARITFCSPRRRILLWALTGVWLGLAMLSKYHAILLVVGLLLFVLTRRDTWIWFREPGPYLGALIAFAIFTPVIVWNGHNEWVSFRFQGGRILESEGFRPDWLARSIIGQAAWIGPLIWVPIIYVYGRSILRGPQSAKSWFICCLASPPILLFTVAALWAPFGWHFHWQAPGYLMLFPLLGKATFQWLQSESPMAARWLMLSAAGLAMVIVLGATQVTTGWVQHIIPVSVASRFSHISDPTLEGYDWTGLREELQRRGLLAKQRLFVIGPSWNQTGQIDVQVGRFLPVACLCKDPRNLAFNWRPDEYIGWDALIIGREEYLSRVVAQPHFRKVERLGDIEIVRGGRVAFTLRVFYATDLYRPVLLGFP